MTPQLPAALRPLAAFAARFPALEGQVIWVEDGQYTAQDAEDLGLDPEEIAFYAEGLLLEGFQLVWVSWAEAEDPADPVLLQLFCAEGTSPALPPAPQDMVACTAPNATGRAAP